MRMALTEAGCADRIRNGITLRECGALYPVEPRHAHFNMSLR